MPSCSQPSRTLRAAEAVARRRASLERRCARRHIARAGRDGRMVPIEQKDWTEEDRASKLGQNHPLDSTKRPKEKRVSAHRLILLGSAASIAVAVVAGGPSGNVVLNSLVAPAHAATD